MRRLDSPHCVGPRLRCAWRPRWNGEPASRQLVSSIKGNNALELITGPESSARHMPTATLRRSLLQGRRREREGENSSLQQLYAFSPRLHRSSFPLPPLPLSLSLSFTLQKFSTRHKTKGRESNEWRENAEIHLFLVILKWAKPDKLSTCKWFALVLMDCKSCGTCIFYWIQLAYSRDAITMGKCAR